VKPPAKRKKDLTTEYAEHVEGFKGVKNPALPHRASSKEKAILTSGLCGLKP